MTAAQLKLCATGRQIKLIMSHQYLRGFDFVELRKGANCTTTDVHKRLGFKQMHFVPVQDGARHQPVKFTIRFEAHTINAREFIHPPESGVVARGCIFLTGIAQSDN
jgi:hypothetical protein